MLALLYDVHGNRPALEAVVADADAAGARRFLLGGDYALFGAWPAETLARLRALPDAVWIRGNGERWTADPGGAPDDPVVQGAIAASRAALGDAAVADLAALPTDFDADGTRYCHASPVSDVRSFWPEAAPEEEELLGDVRGGRLVFGHTHLPFVRTRGEVELVNPGSVGMPFDGDHRAAYALVHTDGRLELRRVAYDHAAVARRLREAFDGDWVRTVAARIEQARFDAAPA